MSLQARYHFICNGHRIDGTTEYFYNDRGWLEMRDWLIPPRPDVLAHNEELLMVNTIPTYQPVRLTPGHRIHARSEWVQEIPRTLCGIQFRYYPKAEALPGEAITCRTCQYAAAIRNMQPTERAEKPQEPPTDANA